LWLEGLGGFGLGRPYNAGSYSVSSNNRFVLSLAGGGDHPVDLSVG